VYSSAPVSICRPQRPTRGRGQATAVRREGESSAPLLARFQGTNPITCVHVEHVHCPGQVRLGQGQQSPAGREGLRRRVDIEPCGLLHRNDDAPCRHIPEVKNSRVVRDQEQSAVGGEGNYGGVVPHLRSDVGPVRLDFPEEPVRFALQRGEDAPREGTANSMRSPLGVRLSSNFFPLARSHRTSRERSPSVTAAVSIRRPSGEIRSRSTGSRSPCHGPRICPRAVPKLQQAAHCRSDHALPSGVKPGRSDTRAALPSRVSLPRSPRPRGECRRGGLHGEPASVGGKRHAGYSRPHPLDGANVPLPCDVQTVSTWSKSTTATACR